ncbi:MAG: hypothetical protein ACKOZT_12945 [Cyanobium sp.]
MSRILRWGIGLLLIAGLFLGAFLFLPFRSWLPGGSVGGIAKREVVNGTQFNKLFPTPQAGEQLVFTQEKRGFSQARLKQDEEVRALLSISDVVTSPASLSKFQQSGEQIQSWPLVDQGSQASALLVADRFQVKVIGQGGGLDRDQRHELLGAFDLPALAALAPALKPSAKTPAALPPAQGEPVRPTLPGQQRQSIPGRLGQNRTNAVLEPAA